MEEQQQAAARSAPDPRDVTSAEPRSPLARDSRRRRRMPREPPCGPVAAKTPPWRWPGGRGRCAARSLRLQGLGARGASSSSSSRLVHLQVQIERASQSL